ncbi:hypothetical protein FRC10_008000 [Ceratobasidium sp. 414]|nr:hypothetical protein FRC10_008000 [Ceratobasidium sp. 414]
MADDSTIELWNFPSLYEGIWMRDSETILCVGAYLKACSGRLRGFVYMRGADDGDEEYQAFSLFKSLLGDDALEKSTIVIPEDGFPSDSPRRSDTPLDILEKFIDQPPIDTLYYQEVSRPGTSLSDTTVGKHIDSLMSDAAEAISRAREHIRTKTLAAQDPHHSINTTPRRSRKSAETALAQELVETRQQLAELEGCRLVSEERSSQLVALGESITELEVENEQLWAKNQEQDRIIQTLRGEVESMRVGPSLKDAGTQAQATLVNAGPFQTDSIADERQEELLSLQSEVSQITTEKDEAISRATQLSKELSDGKAGVVKLRLTITGLEKECSDMKERIEGFSKAADKQRQNLEGSKAETQASQKKLQTAEAELAKSKKEIERMQEKEGKVEEERRSAMKISEGCLKARDESKAELAIVRSQVDSVQKQAKKKIDEFQKSLDEKEGQIASISKAAEAWAVASAEVERLKADIRVEKERARSRYQEAQSELATFQSVLHTEREQRESERVADAGRPEHENVIWEVELGEERDLGERGVGGYLLRTAELEEWGRSRWDAVAGGCIIV